MARHITVEKRARQNIKRNRRNRVVKSQIRGALKAVAANTDAEQAPKIESKTQKIIDRAAAKKVIPKNRASRMKSKLMKKQKAE